MPRDRRPRVPLRIELASGAWLRHREVGNSGQALVTGADGRFVLIDQADVEAVRRGAGDPEDPTRQRLAQLGFLHHDGPEVAPDPAPSSSHHIVYLSTGDGAVMNAQVAEGVVQCMFGARGSHVHLELRGVEPVVGEPVVRTILSLVEQKSRAQSAGLSVSVSTGGGLAQGLLEYLADAGVAWNVHVSVPGPDAFGPIVRLHELYAARGVEPRLAYVTAVLAVTRSVLATDPRALVQECLLRGVAYLLIQPSSPAGAVEAACSADEFRAFHRRIAEAVIEANVAGGFLVDKRLALHLEALTTGPSGPAPVLTAYAPDGRVYASAAGPLFAAGGAERDRIGRAGDSVAELESERSAWRAQTRLEQSDGTTCRSCVYDPYCDRALLRTYLLQDEVAPRLPGSALCERSMASFDDVFALLASPAATELRRVFADWARARRDVARRLSKSGGTAGSV